MFFEIFVNHKIESCCFLSSSFNSRTRDTRYWISYPLEIFSSDVAADADVEDADDADANDAGVDVADVDVADVDAADVDAAENAADEAAVVELTKVVRNKPPL